MRSLPASALFGLALLWSPSAVLAARPRDAILLSDVQSLTLHPGSMTTGRRTSPVPQLKCVPPNSPICRLPDTSDIRTMRCRNAGSSYTSQDIQWSCTASLPSTLKLDTTNVICEGYDSPDDVYVLRGSCGVEYTLSLTEEGRHKYPDLTRGWGGWGKSTSQEGGEMGADGYIFWVIFIAVVVWILYGACFGTKKNETRTAGQGRRAGRDDAPPPYNERWEQPSSSSYTRASSQRQEAGWRPGFWSGMAAGGAAGYAAGARSARNTDGYTRTGTGLFGSGSGTREQHYGGSSRADSHHESTGYGETRRR
ncbi:transmembrane protein [Cladorrhinum sp. PSN332]|nr:transmembrane protein [Cladorrhinum sp. PSN332]